MSISNVKSSCESKVIIVKVELSLDGLTEVCPVRMTSCPVYRKTIVPTSSCLLTSFVSATQFPFCRDPEVKGDMADFSSLLPNAAYKILKS